MISFPCVRLQFRDVRIRSALAFVAMGGGMVIAPSLSAQGRNVVASETQLRVPPPSAVGANVVLAKRVTVALEQVSLQTAIDKLARAGTITVSYNRNVLQAASQQSITVHVTNMALGDAFARILAGTSLELTSLPGGQFSVVRVSPLYIEGSIRGVVTNAETKQPLAGVKVTLDGAATGVLTDQTGAFVFRGVPAGTHTVLVKSLGFSQASRIIRVADDLPVTVTVALAPSAFALDQVVVTGTVAATALKEIPNAMTIITGRELEQRGITHIDQLFHGEVPGLWAQEVGTGNLQPGQITQVTSRGVNTLGGLSAQQTKAMKTYIDGVELADPTYLGLVDPKSVERIEIIPGPQASTIYGSGAIMGVIQIFTKRGTTTRPQLTLNLTTGMIQNNFSSAVTPQHDYSAQISQVDGLLSYNVGGSWNHTGPWSPAVHPTTASGFGGIRAQLRRITADVSLRRTLGTNWQNGNAAQTAIEGQADGSGTPSSLGYPVPYTYSSAAQTLGATLSYASTAWWSHSLTVGSDGITAQNAQRAAQFNAPYDTVLSLSQSTSNQTNVSYTTTLRIPLTSLANATLTGGADGYHSLSTSLTGRPLALTGNGVSSASFTVNRTSAHAHGGFFQGQFGVLDAVFLTYGVRADYNRNYGANANPNLVPRYGISMTRDFGALTAKVRASYGHATRPPLPGQTDAQYLCVVSPSSCTVYAGYFGADYKSVVANPKLQPEQQHGGEGGLELYFGNRGSLTVTRYNQTVHNLIRSLASYGDSVRSLRPATEYNPYNYAVAPNGYVYGVPGIYLNIADIRNQGWAVQGSMTLGPIAARGTYNATKSRVLNVTKLYEDAIGWHPGGSFGGFPEHTYALGVQYARGGTTMGFNLQGQGASWTTTSWYLGQSILNDVATCLRNNRFVAYYCPIASSRTIRFAGPGYLGGGDFNASQRFTPKVDGVLQIFNVRNSYKFDGSPTNATIGRQTKFGLRVRY